jgi:predicted amidohydrolase
MWEARKRGVLFDLGHGAGGFLWPVAHAAMAQGFPPDTIGTDLHPGSILTLQVNVPNAISKLMNLGMTLQDAILRSTVNPAKAIRRFPEFGTLSEGATADIAVFELKDGVFSFIDSARKKFTGTKKLECIMTLRGGKVAFDRDARMLPASDLSPRLAPLPYYPPESAAEESSQPSGSIYDVVLRQGQVIDPGSKRFGRYDVGITGHRIARIARHLPAVQARLVVDVSDYYLTPGLIDVGPDVNFVDSLNGVQPDQHELPYGVTTVADPKASQQVIRRSRALVLAIAPRTPVSAILASGMNRDKVFSVGASMARTLNLRLNEGADFTSLIEGAAVRPAQAIGREDLGRLREGDLANVALFTIERGTFGMADEQSRRLLAKARVVCVMTIRNGDIVWDLHGLSIREWSQAGSYTSYR